MRHAATKPLSALGLSAVLMLPAACSSFAYDLREVPFPVSASPADASAAATPFALTRKDVLWVHGLLGEDQPDVAALLRDECAGCDGVADFRVKVSASFHDWLLTHLTLGFVRMKTVTVTGTRLGGAR